MKIKMIPEKKSRKKFSIKYVTCFHLHKKSFQPVLMHKLISWNLVDSTRANHSVKAKNPGIPFGSIRQLQKRLWQKNVCSELAENSKIKKKSKQRSLLITTVSGMCGKRDTNTDYGRLNEMPFTNCLAQSRHVVRAWQTLATVIFLIHITSYPLSGLASCA